MEQYPNLFCNYHPLRGRDWLRRIPPEDRAVFSHLGMIAHDYGRQGGEVRARTAKRDERGRFRKEERE